MAKLFDVATNIQRSAMMIPTVKESIVGDITELNKRQDVKYPAVVIQQEDHLYNLDNELQTYKFVLWCVDLLQDDYQNELSVQSWAVDSIQALTKYIESLDIGLVNTSVRIKPFTRKFDSLCGGAYAYIEIQTMNTSDCCG